MVDEERQEKIAKVLQTLTYRQQEIIKMRFGLLPNDPFTYTLAEIGAIFGVCREVVRQVEAKALRKLQHPTRSRILIDYYIT